MSLTEQERLIAKVFDRYVEALGIMNKNLCDTIKQVNHDQRRFEAAKAAMQGYCANDYYANADCGYIATISVKQGDELLKQLNNQQQWQKQ